MRRVGQVVLVSLLVVLAFAAWRILGYQSAAPVYPPPPTAVSSAQASMVASRVASQESVDRASLAIDLAPSHAESAQLYVDGVTFYPALLADLRAAQSSIHFEQYGFDPGEVADQFVPVLRDKAQNGVEVRMIVDRFGSGVDGRAYNMYTVLTRSGAAVAVNDPFLFSSVGLFGAEQRVDWRFQQLGHFYHRKMFVIDGLIGWIGGAGIEDPFYDGRYHDVYVRVTGDVVAQMQLTFLTDYRFHRGSLPTAREEFDKYFPVPASAGSIPTTFVTNVPGEDHRAVTDAIWHLLDHAQTRLDIIDPYVADSGTIARIIAAAQRGVHVRFIVPEKSNSPPVQWAFEHHYQNLLDAGVALYLYPTLPHAKVIVADDRVLVGSTNLDSWALYRNWETSLLFEDAKVAEMFEKQLFDPDVSVSKLATAPAGLHRAWAAVWFLMSPIL